MVVSNKIKSSVRFFSDSHNTDEFSPVSSDFHIVFSSFEVLSVKRLIIIEKSLTLFLSLNKKDNFLCEKSRQDLDVLKSLTSSPRVGDYTVRGDDLITPQDYGGNISDTDQLAPRSASIIDIPPRFKLFLLQGLYYDIGSSKIRFRVILKKAHEMELEMSCFHDLSVDSPLREEVLRAGVTLESLEIFLIDVCEVCDLENYTAPAVGDQIYFLFNKVIGELLLFRNCLTFCNKLGFNIPYDMRTETKESWIYNKFCVKAEFDVVSHAFKFIQKKIESKIISPNSNGCFLACSIINSYGKDLLLSELNKSLLTNWNLEFEYRSYEKHDLPYLEEATKITVFKQYPFFDDTYEMLLKKHKPYRPELETLLAMDESERLEAYDQMCEQDRELELSIVYHFPREATPNPYDLDGGSSLR
jgi:hypothetical protein